MKHAVVIFETCSVYQCLDFKQQTTDVSGQMSTGTQRPGLSFMLNDSIHLHLPLVLLACFWLQKYPLLLELNDYFHLIILTLSFKNFCICPAEAQVSEK